MQNTENKLTSFEVLEIYVDKNVNFEFRKMKRVQINRWIYDMIASKHVWIISSYGVVRGVKFSAFDIVFV